jgi:hypothetical protein
VIVEGNVGADTGAELRVVCEAHAVDDVGQPWPQMSSSYGQVERRTRQRVETRSNGMVFSLDDRRHFGYGLVCLPTASPFDGGMQYCSWL